MKVATEVGTETTEAGCGLENFKNQSPLHFTNVFLMGLRIEGNQYLQFSDLF